MKKIPIKRTEASDAPEFEQVAERVLHKNQELYKRLAREEEAPPPSPDSGLDEAKAFSEVRRQYRDTLKKLSQ